MPNIRDSLSVASYSASVNLLNLFDHNAACLVYLQKDLLLQKPDKYVRKLVIMEQQINLFTSSYLMKTSKGIYRKKKVYFSSGFEPSLLCLECCKQICKFVSMVL